MKKLIFKIILGIHLLINISFLYWYIWDGGFLGYGYGELVYVLIILIFTLISISIIFFFNKIIDHIYLIEIFLLCYNIWFINLLYKTDIFGHVIKVLI